MLKRVFKNFTVFLTGNAIASIISLVNITLITKLLDFDGYGIFIFCQSVYILSDVIFNIRGWQSVISRKVKGKNLIADLFYVNICISLIGCVIFICGIFISKELNIISSKDIVVGSITYVSLLVFRNIDSCYVLLRRDNNYKLISHANIFLTLSRFVFLFACFSLSTKISVLDIIVYFVMTEIVYYISLNIYCNRKYFNYLRYNKISKRNYMYLIKNGIRINLINIADLPYSTLDTFIIKYFYGLDVLGFYKLCKKAVSILGRIISPLNQVLLPELAAFKNDSVNQYDAIKKTILISFLISSVVCIIIIFATKLNVVTNMFSVSISQIEFFYFLLILEVAALTFSVLSMILMINGKVIYDFYNVLISNAVYLIMIIIMGYMNTDYFITIILSIFIQILMLISLRIYTLRTK